MLKPDPPAPSTVNDLDNASLLDGFFEQLRVKPSDTALLDQNGEWSYDEVFRAAASVARALISLDAPEASTCFIVANRSRHSVAAAFGALMAGWRYCLVDSGYPAEKLDPVLDRLQPGAVVDCTSEKSGADTPIATGLARLRIDDLIGNEGKLSAEVSENEIERWSARLGRGDDVAFYTFTSGTTGTPKIPVISHGSFLDITRRYIADYELTSHDRIAVQSGFMFDAMLDVFAATQCGAVAVIMPDLLFEDGRSWTRFLRQHGATTLLTVPAALQYALESMPRGQPLPPFRQLILTGDRVSRHVLNLIERHVPRDVVLHNSYGVAEALYITTGIVDTDHPETASLFYLPDADRVDYRLVPLNDGNPVGHLLQVRGNGVFLGYTEEPEGDCTKIDPARSDDGYYDTGDVFHVVPPREAGDRPMLRLVGRLDRRLNWLGHRIEPEEIELAAEAIPGVEKAEAIISNDGRLICRVYGEVSEDAFSDFKPISALPPGAITVCLLRSHAQKRKFR